MATSPHKAPSTTGVGKMGQGAEAGAGLNPNLAEGAGAQGAAGMTTVVAFTIIEMHDSSADITGLQLQLSTAVKTV